MAPAWTLLAISIFSLGLEPARCSTGPDGLRYQQKEEAGGTDAMQFNMRSSVIQFIVHKGCDYVSAYVMSRYSMHYSHFDHAHSNLAPPSPDHDDRLSSFGRRFLTPKCDWKDPVERFLNAAHAPSELIDALLDCGPAYSYKAIGVTDWYHAYNHCNITVTDHDHDHHVVIGKRGTSVNHVFATETNDVSRVPSDIERLPVAKRAGVSRSASVLGQSGQGGSAGRSQPHNTEWYASDQVLQNDELSKWCDFYERKVNRKFHLSSRRFQHTSPLWLVDVYHMAKTFHIPKSYIHGLVGCGKEYAIDAFVVPDRIAVLYTED